MHSIPFSPSLLFAGCQRVDSDTKKQKKEYKFKRNGNTYIADGRDAKQLKVLNKARHGVDLDKKKQQLKIFKGLSEKQIIANAQELYDLLIKSLAKDADKEAKQKAKKSK